MIHVVADGEGVAAAAARLVGTMVRGRAEQTEGDVSLVLSGGSTPRRLYEMLALESRSRVPWTRLSLFWGDERCVPPEDVRSNYGMTSRTGLLDRPVAGIHRMHGEFVPEEGAAAYEEELRAILAGGPIPRFDLILLGLGEDAHTASLFAGSPGLTERHYLVVATESYEGTRRLTLTLPMLAAARSLLFLVSGQEKAEAVRRVLSKERETVDETAPARLLLDMIAVKRKAGWECPSVTWVLDRAAAALLPARRPRLDAGPAPR
jgi:6-phosphogluconolactonase